MNALSYLYNNQVFPSNSSDNNNSAAAFPKSNDDTSIIAPNIINKKPITTNNIDNEKDMTNVTTITHMDNTVVKQSQNNLKNVLPSLSDSSHSIYLSVLLFLPKYVVVKPAQFIWYFFTFPLLLIENNAAYDNNNNNENNKKDILLGKKGNKLGADDDLNSNDEIIFQTDSIKGSLLQTTSNDNNAKKKNSVSKSTNNIIISNSATSNKSINFIGSKNMGRFLFPKKLIPNSILKNYDNHKKKLVLDLDETLIHSMARYGSMPMSSATQSHIVEVKFPHNPLNSNNNLSMNPNFSIPNSTLYHVFKRPYCDHFLKSVSKWYDLIIFTASLKEYADPVIDWLENSLPITFEKRLYRDHCILRDGIGYIKDLSVLNKVYSNNDISSSNTINTPSKKRKKRKKKIGSGSSPLSMSISTTSRNNDIKNRRFSTNSTATNNTGITASTTNTGGTESQHTFESSVFNTTVNSNNIPDAESRTNTSHNNPSGDEDADDDNNPIIPLNEVILIDNSPVSFAMNVDNAIQVQGWISDPTDTELLNILPFLESLRHTTDVRNVLALKNGERAFNFS